MEEVRRANTTLLTAEQGFRVGGLEILRLGQRLRYPDVVYAPLVHRRDGGGGTESVDDDCDRRGLNSPGRVSCDVDEHPPQSTTIQNVTDSRPIGFFDSGIGGVAVLAEVRRLLPAEQLIYFADRANFPYGPKTDQQIVGLARAASERLLERSVKAIVVACNTASTVALSDLRARYDIPFVGMVPAVKPASTLSRSGKVGVLATEATSQGETLADLITQFANGATVTTVAAAELASLVEQGAEESEIEPRLRHYLDPLLADGVDTVVLGCTHYFFLRPLVERLTSLTTLDAAEPVARRVAQVLTESGLLAPPTREGGVEYMTSGDSRELARVLDHWRKAGSSIP